MEECWCTAIWNHMEIIKKWKGIPFHILFIHGLPWKNCKIRPQKVDFFATQIQELSTTIWTSIFIYWGVLLMKPRSSYNKMHFKRYLVVIFSPVFTLGLHIYHNNIGEWVSESVSQSVSPSELHVQKSCACTTVQSIECSHVQLWYIAVYDYVLKCIDLGI